MSRDSLVVDEVFCSIQGESTDAGLPCVFVRLFGCNVGCAFCDQIQNPKNVKRYSIAKLIYLINSFHIPYVCITGGEPLLQWDSVYPLILELVSLSYKVSIETSGCLPIDFDPYNRSFKYIMDIKCPSSGVSRKNVYENLMNLQMKDEVKFVISNREDYEFMRKVLRQYPTPAHILVSPCFSPEWKPLISDELVQWLIEDHLVNVRVQIQMHKVLGVK